MRKAYIDNYYGEDYVTAPVVNSPFSVLYGWLAALAGGYIQYEVISRIPVLRWCVLGIRKS